MNLTEGVNISPLDLFKTLLAFALIFMGMLICLLLLYHVYQFFQSPQLLAAFNQLIPVPTPIRFSNAQTSLTIPTQIVVYIVPLLLLGIPVNVANIFISNGVKLLQTKQDIIKEVIRS